MVEWIAQRISELHAAESVDELIEFSIGRCHRLKGSRKDEFALDLVHPYRLVFSKMKDVVKVVKVLSIEDYH